MKTIVYKKLKELNAEVLNVRKVALYNIVFHKWEDIGLIKDIFTQTIKTLEQPEGYHYNENDYRVVLRVCNGKVYRNDNKLDVYCWSEEDYKAKADTVQPIGANTALAQINLSELLHTVKSYEDKIYLADFFTRFRVDFWFIESKEENRKAIEITDELYAAGITSCIDKWVKPDANGNYEVTELKKGDFLILDDVNQMVYRIERDIFLDTHEILD